MNMMTAAAQINMVDGRIQAISLWHPVNGKWVLITQMYSDSIFDNTVRYYVDGIEVFPPVFTEAK